MITKYTRHVGWRKKAIREVGFFLLIIALVIGIILIAYSDSGLAAPVGAPVAEQEGPPAVWIEDGDTGEDVLVVQSILDAWGWTITQDGYFGPQTEGVVTRYQEASGLAVDGIVGPQTWGSLQAVASGPPAIWTIPAEVTGTTPVVRGEQSQVTPLLPAPPPAVSLGVNGDCDSWRPVVEWIGQTSGRPIDWSWAKRIMFRESSCDIRAFNGNGNTGDESYGLMQVNRYGSSLRNWWSSGGFTQSVFQSDWGSLAAFGTLWEECGTRSWSKPYGCDGSYDQTPRLSWNWWQDKIGAL